jgi:hypothetical protein
VSALRALWATAYGRLALAATITGALALASPWTHLLTCAPMLLALKLPAAAPAPQRGPGRGRVGSGAPSAAGPYSWPAPPWARDSREVPAGVRGPGDRLSGVGAVSR